MKIKVQLPNKAEPLEYTIYPLPELKIGGILSATLFLELVGKTKIVSSEGYTTEIEFVPKGWFSGDYFQIKGEIKNNDDNAVAYKLSGSWSGLSKSQDVSTGQEETLFDADKTPRDKPQVAKEADLSENETFKVWGKVSKALKVGNYAEASRIKTEIEEAQRKIRRERKENGEVWNPQHFAFTTVESEEDDQGAVARDPQNRTASQQDNDEDHEVSEKGHWNFIKK